MELKPKQQRFADEYLIDLNACQAAIRAGYSINTARQQGQRLLTKDYIKAYIQKRMQEKEKELIADQDEVLKYLSSVLRGESRSSEIVVEALGDGSSSAREMEKAPSEKDKLKAAELLGKRYGIYTDKVSMDLQPVVISGADDLE